MRLGGKQICASARIPVAYPISGQHINLNLNTQGKRPRGEGEGGYVHVVCKLCMYGEIGKWAFREEGGIIITL